MFAFLHGGELGKVNVFVDINDALALTSVLLDYLVVHVHYLHDTTDLEGEAVFLSKFLEDRTKFRIVVARHCGKEMMLKLILHTTEEILSHKIIAVNTSCALKVICNIAVTGVCSDNLFCLMVTCHHNSDQKSSDQDTEDWNKRWHGGQPDITSEDNKAFSPVARTNYEFDTLNSPRHMEERIGERIINMLVLTIPDITVSLGKPKMNKRLVMNIHIDLKSVWEDVMSVVLMAPPL